MSIKHCYCWRLGIESFLYLKNIYKSDRIICALIDNSQEAGKSTLIGVLCTGKLDNGKGLARTQVFRHNHEIETGRTSCISHHLLHFDDNGQVWNWNPAAIFNVYL